MIILHSLSCMLPLLYSTPASPFYRSLYSLTTADACTYKTNTSKYFLHKYVSTADHLLFYKQGSSPRKTNSPSLAAENYLNSSILVVAMGNFSQSMLVIGVAHRHHSWGGLSVAFLHQQLAKHLAVQQNLDVREDDFRSIPSQICQVLWQSVWYLQQQKHTFNFWKAAKSNSNGFYCSWRLN